MNDIDWHDWTTGVGLIVGCAIIGVFVVWVVGWLIMPFIIFSRLRSLDFRVQRATKLAESIEKNTRDVAKFFNEKDVRIE